VPDGVRQAANGPADVDVQPLNVRELFDLLAWEQRCTNLIDGYKNENLFNGDVNQAIAGCVAGNTSGS
jgi:hypothetical protein